MIEGCIFEKGDFINYQNTSDYFSKLILPGKNFKQVEMDDFEKKIIELNKNKVRDEFPSENLNYGEELFKVRDLENTYIQNICFNPI